MFIWGFWGLEKRVGSIVRLIDGSKGKWKERKRNVGASINVAVWIEF